jgi:PIN domain nuclease of toxin-antitoxin system
LDTHAVFWALIEPQKLSPLARTEVGSGKNEVLVSVASLWEMAIKAGLG